MEEISDLDCLILAVAHQEFRKMAVEQYLKLFRDIPNEEKVMIDVKGVLNTQELQQAGVRYWRL
jgi:UDP-N-acetyl-D-galactosamine dehydrogenase